MTEPQVTVRSTEAGHVTPEVSVYADGRGPRITEVVLPEGRLVETVADMIRAQIPRAAVYYSPYLLAIRQPNGPDVVALAGETLRIAAGRVERVREDERHGPAGHRDL